MQNLVNQACNQFLKRFHKTYCKPVYVQTAFITENDYNNNSDFNLKQSQTPLSYKIYQNSRQQTQITQVLCH